MLPLEMLWAGELLIEHLKAEHPGHLLCVLKARLYHAGAAIHWIFSS